MASYLGVELFLGINQLQEIHHWLIPNEFWKDIKGYESIYQVSSSVRIKSLSRLDMQKKPLKEKIMIAKKGQYKRIPPHKHPLVKHFSVHRLVAEAFIPNPENKPQVNHKNGMKYNNYTWNLEWATAKENSIHAWSTGLNEHARLNLREIGKKRKGIPQQGQNVLNKDTGIYYMSLNDAIKSLGNPYNRSYYNRRLRGKLQNNTNLIYV